MRRLLVPLIFLTIACRALAPAASDLDAPSSLVSPSAVIPSPSASASAAADAAAAAIPPPPESEQASALPPTPTPDLKPDTAFSVRLHPDGPLYVGDIISLEVVPTQDVDLAEQRIQVQFDDSEGTQTASGEFSDYGIGGRSQSTLLWAWDTAGLEAGQHNLSFSIIPEGQVWTETVSLLPSNEVPLPEPDAVWAVAENDCCLVYYITRTDAERDLPELLIMVDEQAQKVQRLLDVELGEPISIVLMPRVLGHGGFAREEISVSYLDRNYAGSGSDVVLHHEIVHVLDSRLGGEMRPTLLVEGLAVYLTGGHFKYELLMPRAAALLPPDGECSQVGVLSGGEETHFDSAVCGLDWYLPLDSLINNFYFSQHEIGYLQAGAVIEFMVNTWGWQAFSDFYRDIHNPPPLEDDMRPAGGPQWVAIDLALQEHFDINLSTLEGRFLHALRQQPLTPELVDDVRLTVQFYDTVRRYQQLLDPSAYFLSAWLPEGPQMRERSIVADYLRRPAQPENLAIETLLVVSDAAIRSGDYDQAEEMLLAIDAILDVVERGEDVGERTRTHPRGSVLWTRKD